MVTVVMWVVDCDVDMRMMSVVIMVIVVMVWVVNALMMKPYVKNV